MPGHLIRRLHQIGVAIFMESTKDIGLTPIQYATLTVADSYPGIDQRRLSELVAFDRSTIGDVIHRLEQRGLLARVSGVDRRTKNVSLTPEGGKVLAAMDDLVFQSQLRILAPLSDGEQLIFMFLLSKLVNRRSERLPTALLHSEHGATHDQMIGLLQSAFRRPVERGADDKA
ncbi:MAG TPA: MarR family transcriptional regulator [Phenylobacterium sp.]|uniref:MarR family winged helix-turn-helix transcriptional regulator n=1 Tax=Phenylobacterium sp. TaxID=1871053 RepID=UPI002B45B662|nr:MarR family transcriptional regulator [Phenylobacterium sp.]HKR87363.1 MarR family transcriptional regulator [Phenylobacterium sp.]